VRKGHPLRHRHLARPTLATPAKGAPIAEAPFDAMARDIDSLRTTPLP
jgi:hypothetical protein